MRLLHYSNEEFEFDPTMEYRDFHYSKPNGLWVSVEGEDDWKWWCEAEEFQLENLTVSYEVKLKENANILYLNSPEELFAFTKELFAFTKKYPFATRVFDKEYDTYKLNWAKIKEKYQGIIIPKYFWECRLALESNWYYGWDCASGCIWDLNCIDEFNLTKEEEGK